MLHSVRKCWRALDLNVLTEHAIFRLLGSAKGSRISKTHLINVNSCLGQNKNAIPWTMVVARSSVDMLSKILWWFVLDKRERERERERETDRQTDRQTDRDRENERMVYWTRPSARVRLGAVGEVMQYVDTQNQYLSIYILTITKTTLTHTDTPPHTHTHARTHAQFWNTHAHT